MRYLTLRHLTDAFYRTYPDLRTTPLHPLAASYDIAVGQFPRHLNALGFLAGFTCPGSTPACRACCYTQGGRAGLQPALQARARNTHTLLQLCQREDVEALAGEVGRLMDHAYGQYRRRLQGGGEIRFRAGALFRHHWSGDLVDATHAQATYQATARRPELQCWLYTRSFHLLPLLDPPPPNLTVWISQDDDNYHEAEQGARHYPWARRAVLKRRDEVREADRVCTKLREGRRVATAGACARCRICVQPSAQENRLIFPIKPYAHVHPIPDLPAPRPERSMPVPEARRGRRPRGLEPFQKRGP
ncbi:MAG: hypothetical protein ABIL09_12560 [Gemmatimonadota bacterium]